MPTGRAGGRSGPSSARCAAAIEPDRSARPGSGSWSRGTRATRCGPYPVTSTRSRFERLATEAGLRSSTARTGPERRGPGLVAGPPTPSSRTSRGRRRTARLTELRLALDRTAGRGAARARPRRPGRARPAGPRQRAPVARGGVAAARARAVPRRAPGRGARSDPPRQVAARDRTRPGPGPVTGRPGGRRPAARGAPRLSRRMTCSPSRRPRTSGRPPASPAPGL